MKKKQKLDVIFILDKSGSMGGSEDNTISSFNEYLEREKKNSFDTYITTVLFSDTFEYLHNSLKVTEVKNLTNKDYYVGGCTALYDALGNTINNVEKNSTDKVLFVIITDGYENASKEYDRQSIRNLISNHTDWEFIYIGADIDSYTAGGDIGIKQNNIANFVKDAQGTARLFKSIGNFESAMMCEDKCSSDWKSELDEYINQNK